MAQVEILALALMDTCLGHLALGHETDVLHSPCIVGEADGGAGVHVGVDKLTVHGLLGGLGLWGPNEARHYCRGQKELTAELWR